MAYIEETDFRDTRGKDAVPYSCEAPEAVFAKMISELSAASDVLDIQWRNPPKDGSPGDVGSVNVIYVVDKASQTLTALHTLGEVQLYVKKLRGEVDGGPV